MIPNPDIWGSSDTWRSPEYLDAGGEVCSRIGGKFPVFDPTLEGNEKFFLRTGVNIGRLTYGEQLDSSCCPWRIKGDSHWINGLKLLSFATVGDERKAKLDFAYNSETRGNGCPVMLSALTSLDGKLYNTDYIWSPDYSQPGFTPLTYQQTSPLLEFNYSKIVIVPSIRASATPGGSTTRYGLDEYINGNGITEKPYIQALNFRFWTRDSNNVLRDSDGMISIHPFNAVCNGAEISVPSLSEEFTSYEGFFDGDSYNSSGHGDSYVDFNPNYIGGTVKTTNDNVYTAQHELPYIACPEDAEITLSTSEYEVRASWTMTAEEIISEYAKLGFWIWAGGDGTGSVTPTWDPSQPDEHTIIPLFDDYGTTTGNYLRGAAALTAPAASWTDDIFERNIYHGEPPYDPTHYDPDNTTVFPSAGAWTISEGFYGIPYEQMQPALQYLYTWAQSQQEIDSIKEFLVTDPIEVVHSLTIFPINIVPDSLSPPYDIYNAIFPTAPIVNIQFGNIVSTIQAFNIPYRSGIIDMGYIDVFETFRNFLDYSPYTSLMIYLPFCGFQALDCDKYMGHKINIKYVVDFATGSCTALLLRDNLVCDTVNGQMGVTVSLTGLRASQVQSAVDSAMLQYKQRSREAAVGLASLTAGAAGAALSGNPLALGGSILGAANLAAKFASADENLEYNLSHIHTPFATVGASTSAISGNMELTPRLYISRPMMLSSYDPSIYAHTIGYSCLLNVQLSQVEGFTRCASADLSGIPATAQEKQLLLRLLQSGIYM